MRFDKIATLNRSILKGRLGKAGPVWLAGNRPEFYPVFGFSALTG